MKMAIPFIDADDERYFPDENAWFNIVLVMVLMALVALIASLINRRKTRQLEEKHKAEAERERVNTELQMANRIQMATLPHEYPPFPDRTEFDIFASSDPAREVGGDFYDYFLIDDDHLAMVIADVSGKGIPASLYMMTTKVVLQTVAKSGMPVDEVDDFVKDAEQFDDLTRLCLEYCGPQE